MHPPIEASQLQQTMPANNTSSTATTASHTGSTHSGIHTRFATELNDELIPNYLHDTYWWAYTNPNAVKFWERQFLVDAILWGNFNTLKKQAIHELHALLASQPYQVHSKQRNYRLRVTQIACVYGNFSTDLIAELASIYKYNKMDDAKYTYKIVDIAPIQLVNTKQKIDRYLTEHRASDHEQWTNAALDVELYQSDSMDLQVMHDGSEDITYLFFLLHEQPKEVRLKTLAEAIRITKPGGRIVIVDYHKPTSQVNPFRYIMYPILTYLEPFAIDLWNEEITDYIRDLSVGQQWNVQMEKTLFFHGLYQKIVLRKGGT